MARRYLEITKETAARAGFYKGLPPNPIGWEVIKWYKKEGEVIQGVKNDDTGTVTGEIILYLANTEKGAKDIEAEDWEIGAQIVKILLPEGSPIEIDLHKEPLRLAELEVADDGGKADGGKPETPQKKVRITPLAEEAMLKLKVKADDVIASLPEGSEELTAEHVKEFAASKPSGIKAAPKTRQVAKERGIDLATIPPSGPDSIIRLQDLENTAKRPEFVPEAEEDDYEIIKPTMRRRGTARHMSEVLKIPHAGPDSDVNPTPLLELRERLKEPFEKLHGLKLRIDHFFVAACAWLLKQQELRILNGYWHEEKIHLYRHINVGVAVTIPPEKTSSGFSELVVPSVKNAGKLSFVEIAIETERLIAEAVGGNPKMEDLLGATFTVNNTGAPVEWRGMKFPGAEFPNSVMVPRTAAILSFGAAREENGQKKMRLSLRFDHRICDGYEATRFIRALQYLIEHPEQILAL